MKKMFVCGLFLLLCAWLISPAQAETVVAVGSVKSLDALMEKADDLLDVVDRGDFKAAFGASKFLFTETGPVGAILDTSRPAGLIVLLKEDCEKCPVTGFVAIPVRNWDKLLGFAKSKNVPLEEQGENLWKIAGPKGKTVFVKKDGDWLLAAEKECGFACVDYAKFIAENTERVDVGFSIFAANIPDKYKEKGVELLGKFLKKGAKKHLKGEAPSEAAVAACKNLLSHIKGGLEDLDMITYGHCWNMDADEYSLSVTVTAKAGTETARKLEGVGTPRKTNFAGFRCEEATFVLAKNFIFRPFSKDLLNEIGQKHGEKVEKKIREKAGEHADGAVAFFKKNQELIGGMLLDGNIDSALAVKIAEDNVVLAAARYVPDGYAWEEQFKKVVAFAKAKGGEKCEKHVKESGTFEKGDLHIYWAKIAIPEKVKGECREKLVKALGGEAVPAVLVFGPKAVYFAAGKEAAGVLKHCIEASAEPKELPVFYAHLSAMDVLKLVASCDKCPKQADLQKSLKKIGDVGRGLLTWAPEKVENGFKVRFRATTSAVKMLKGI